MNEPIITVAGNIAGEVQLRYAPSGVAVARFTVVQAPRTKNKQTDRWEDGTPMWFRVTVFRQLAEMCAESFAKGDRVIATGKLTREEWKTDNNEARESWSLTAEDVGASVKFAQVDIKKVARGSDEPPRRRQEPQVDDPWATGPNPSTTADEEPPF